MPQGPSVARLGFRATEGDADGVSLDGLTAESTSVGRQELGGDLLPLGGLA
ncbi:hypothetical protein [Nocardioides sp.]|uniref:hypothetical protein n=1 Tax=Nocardioides sp. TaxID=35761 RepID=UPI0027356572|nr:hypothetical protein [Nocardioides sp.]MDP3893626.1 hypothetical protein [Nocardioides sp.]